MEKINSSKTFIVDDDPFWTAMLTQILEDLDITNIDTFSNGEDCISNLGLNPGVIFLDYEMDDMNGLEALKKIKEYNAEIKVIFCTAHEDLAVAVDALQYGSFDYLLKENANKKQIKSLLELN